MGKFQFSVLAIADFVDKSFLLTNSSWKLLKAMLRMQNNILCFVKVITYRKTMQSEPYTIRIKYQITCSFLMIQSVNLYISSYIIAKFLYLI